MQARRSDKHQHILQTGLSLLSRQGLAGVTLGRLAAEVGMSKSGLFTHFRSKEEVELGLLEHLSESFSARIVEPVMQSPAGLPRLRAVVDFWFGWSARAACQEGARWPRPCSSATTWKARCGTRF